VYRLLTDIQACRDVSALRCGRPCTLGCAADALEDAGQLDERPGAPGAFDEIG